MKPVTIQLIAISIIILSAAAIIATGISGPLYEAFANATRGEILGFAGGVAGGLCTIFAAFIAWLSVRPALIEAKKQSASAARQAVLSLANEAEREIDVTSQLSSEVLLVFTNAGDLHRSHRENDIYSAESNAIGRLGSLREIKVNLHTAQLRDDNRSLEFDRRQKLIELASRLSDNLTVVYTGCLQGHSDLQGDEVNDESYKLARAAIEQDYHSGRDLTADYRRHTEERLQQLHRRARELEKIAIG